MINENRRVQCELSNLSANRMTYVLAEDEKENETSDTPKRIYHAIHYPYRFNVCLRRFVRAANHLVAVLVLSERGYHWSRLNDDNNIKSSRDHSVS